MTLATQTQPAAPRAAMTRADESAFVRKHAPLIDRLARQIAHKVSAPHIAGDLWTVGALGLLEAARRFEEGRGAKFETFAEHRVRGAMLDELRRMDHLPRRLRARIDTVATKRRELSAGMPHAASDGEVADALGLDIAQLQEVEALAQPQSPIDALLFTRLSEDEGADEVLERRQLTAQLARGVSQLPERLQVLLSLHYVEGMTYREIASVLGVSQPRVCQLHTAAMAQLRELVHV